MPVIEHKCFGVLDDGQHTDTCYCGKSAVAHIYYGTGCGHVCADHAQAILKRKRLPGNPRYVRWLHAR